MLHGSNFDSLVGDGTDASRKLSEVVNLAPTSASSEARVGATQDHTSAITTAITQEQSTATETSLSSLDQIVVMGRTKNEDTSWVEKLPTSVFSAALNLAV
jgi:hypothetical protein